MVEHVSVFLSIAILGLFGVWLVVYVPYDMAKRRGRDPVVWVLVSLLAPLLPIGLLWLLGNLPAKQNDTPDGWM